MNIDVNRYKTLIFDCDGVILDSNRLKTQAFFEASKKYGKRAATKLVEYHLENGGVSRFKKFEYFFSDILKKSFTKSEFEAVLEDYSLSVKNALLSCEVAKGLVQLRKLTSDSKWLVASGGAQTELRGVFSKRKIDHFFDSGIYGSPASKEEIIREQLISGNIIEPVLFVGDSRYDHVVAEQANFDFIFVAEWSEFSDLRSYASQKSVVVIDTLDDLMR